MAQPPNFAFEPTIPITFVFTPPPIQAEDQEEFDLDKLEFDETLDSFTKRWEHDLKAAYKKKVFKAVLQGEIYSVPVVKEKK